VTIRSLLGGVTAVVRPGQMLPAAAFVALALALIAGLVIDGGAAFEARREAANLADGAARAGAGELDEAAFRSAGVVALDPLRARATAAAWLAPEAGLIEVAASAPGGPLDTVTVTVTRAAPTSFMRLVGVGGVTVRARAIARLEVEP
jgi:Flp pilus assembly protein TadG